MAGYPSVTVTENDDRRMWRPDRPGTYEVWFLTFTDPVTGQGFWIRSTLRGSSKGKAKDGPPEAGVWFARFHPADAAANFGIHRWRPASASAPGALAEGELDGDGHRASWSLRWPTGEPTYRLLPDWAYGRAVAATKPYATNPSTRVSGAVIVDGERVDLDGVPAQEGHVFGTRHAERWAWAHCSDFEDEGAVVQALTAQGRRGGFLTPFVTSIGVRWDGRWIRLSKIGRRREFGLGTWHVSLGDRRYRLTGRIEAPARDLLRARYEDPGGAPRYCHNSEIASCRLALFERRAGGFEEVALLESKGTTHAEWAGRTPAAAVPREHVNVT